MFYPSLCIYLFLLLEIGFIPSTGIWFFVWALGPTPEECLYKLSNVSQTGAHIRYRLIMKLHYPVCQER